MSKDVWYKLFLLVCFLSVWVWAAWEPLYREDWLLENYLVFIFVPLILFTARWFRLSNISYTLLTLFMIMHVIGSHYTYAEVPFGETLREWFGAERNMYDRLVHFSYGLLLAYPFLEIFTRVARVKGVWRYFFPVELVFAMSAIYEIIEWLAAQSVDPEAGLAFLGAQGDVWDAQKDMFLAGLGACIAMAIVFTIHARLEDGFWGAIRDSVRIGKGKETQ